MFQIGQEVEVVWSDPHRCDEDLQEWLEEKETNKITISEIDEESRLVWTEDCPYSISFDDIRPLVRPI